MGVCRECWFNSPRKRECVPAPQGGKSFVLYTQMYLKRMCLQQGYTDNIKKVCFHVVFLTLENISDPDKPNPDPDPDTPNPDPDPDIADYRIQFRASFRVTKFKLF